MPDSATAGKLVPLRAGMFEVPDKLGAPVRLLGGRCSDCDEPCIPRRAFCANCTGANVEPVSFAPTGKVDTFTIVRQQLPGSAMVPPYAIVRVRLDDGPSVQTVAVGDGSNVKIGAPVELVAERIKEDEAGDTVVSFMARPLA
ncbi:MAG: Zn-ribbon domain-containing OB-fold protein [Dehalococcoidia bacterium]